MPKTIRTISLYLVFLVCGQCFGQSSTSVSASSEGIPERERQVLAAVFQATNGNHWKNHDGWLGSGTECDWHGVTCEQGADGSKRVGHLDLSENNLIGHIPDKISELANLESLTIFGNQLSGRLPDPVVVWFEPLPRN